jgi:DNA-binding MarR family transcriptional regulator
MSGSDRAGRGAAVIEVIEEAAALHLRANAAVERLHQQPELTGACRGVLRDLERSGPRTVPQLARRRECSRQHVQILVNRLVAGGMAELLPNPDHRRSALVSLTPAGRDALTALWRREAELAAGLPVESSMADLRRAAELLRELRGLLEASRAPIVTEEEP